MPDPPINAQLIAFALVQHWQRASLGEIYREIEKLLPDWPDRYKDHDVFEASVRSTIEYYCPQSENYRAGNEAFFERVGRRRLSTCSCR